jgi:hypothetical protein
MQIEIIPKLTMFKNSLMVKLIPVLQPDILKGETEYVLGIIKMHCC